MATKPPLSRPLRALLRLLSLAAAALVLGVSVPAAAADTRAVPMCGEHNESVAAPPTFRSQNVGSIAAPCKQLPSFDHAAPSAPAPERVAVPDRPERALPSGALYLALGASKRIGILAAERAVSSTAHARLPYRPPRG
jgi:hypothetical protein